MGEPAVPGVDTSRIVHVLRNRMGVGKIDLQAAAEIERLEARALAAEAALAGEREPTVEIRRNDDGAIDEVVAKCVTVHLEQLEAGAWFLGLDAGEQTWQFWLRAKNAKTRVDIYHEQSAAIRAQGA